MAYNYGSTSSQRRYIESLAKKLTDCQLDKAIRRTGTSSSCVYNRTMTRNQRLKYLTKNYASILIDLLLDREYVDSLVATDGYEDKDEDMVM